MIITTIICCILSALNIVNGMMTLVEQETEMITIRNEKFVHDVDTIQIPSYISVTHSDVYQYTYTNLKVCILVWPHLYQAKKS
jgi:hypothetical protein